ncbi:MAG: inositol monophosphatase family protein [Pirellulaceae bacterium]|nr:inositol monophosphatase family protein [Pirellulaceae bacterium]
MFEQKELEVARAAAMAASDVLNKYFRSANLIDFKSTYNLVSQADRESEATIVEVIRQSFPEHEILGEEDESGDITAENLWIVDPLDGTNNFCHGLNHFAISIGYYRNGQPELGVVHQPISNEWFIAGRGKGAFHNGAPCQTASFSRLNQSLIGTGFYYDRGAQMSATLEAMEALFQKDIHGIRRMGTASLDLCMVGCGIFGGYFEFELAPWDYAAGRLFVEEAGGVVTNCEGGPIPIGNSSVIAGCPNLHPILLELIQPFFQKAARTA